MKAIETVHLTKNYNEILALKNVNLTVDEGEIFGLIGPNGAGKSTFIKILLNFIFPNIGHCKVLDLNCTKNSAEIKKQVGYVPDEIRYDPNASAEELLKTTLAFHHIKTEDAIDPLCEALEIDKSIKFGEQSIDNEKKIAIACALIHEPRLLILDEPMNGLDPLMQKRLFEVLKDANEKGTTIFLSSQNLKEVQDYCTRVAFIKEGRIFKIEDLTKVRKKYMIIEIKAESFDLRDLEILGGRMLNVSENMVKFSYDGDVEKLLKTLSMMAIKDITIKNASLEDEVLDYYEGGHSDDTLEIGI